MAQAETQVELVRVKRVRDASGAYCLDCKELWTDLTNQSVPWTWRNSKAMHEKGTGHRVVLVAYK